MEDKNNDAAELQELGLDYLKELDLSKTPDLQTKLIFSGKRPVTTQLKLLKKKGIPIEITYKLLGLSVIKAVYEAKDSQPNYQTDDHEVSKAIEAKIISMGLEELTENLPNIKAIKKVVGELEIILYKKIDQNSSTLPENAAKRIYNILIEKKPNETNWPPKSIDLYQEIGKQIEMELDKKENIDEYKNFIREIENINREVFFLRVKKERGEVSEEEYTTQTVKQCIERDITTGKRFAEEEKYLLLAVETAIKKTRETIEVAKLKM